MERARKRLFELESVVDGLFDFFYPVAPKSNHPSGRAYRPMLAESLGCLVPGVHESSPGSVRNLVEARDYYRVDLPDFL